MEGISEKRYREYLILARNITNNDPKHQDLLHDVLLQLNTNIKWNSLSTKQEQIYFLTRTLLNQFRSNNSIFHRTYRKYVFEEVKNLEIEDDEYKERPTIEWINETLEQELKKEPNKWYEIGLFKMYLENTKIDTIHKKTKIPKYSIRITIKMMKKWLKDEWTRTQI